MAENDQRTRITIAILALGGQGGGVLADWIRELGTHSGYVAQATSVPGVAQRTGSTVYYVEMFPAGEFATGEQPVLALMPVPGDVDIVIASELMEAGRAILRGFVTADRTTLIGSTHRIYAISEKSAMSDGRASGQRILDAATERAKHFIGFDMEELANKSGSVISAIMFGALAGSSALPFTRDQFENAIRSGGKAVESNLRAFAAGYDAARHRVESVTPRDDLPQPTSETGRLFLQRIEQELPLSAHRFAIEGVRRLMDYQDADYARLYLDRLASIRAVDKGGDEWRITREAARYLALWMSYEDTIRVADLKLRGSRFERVKDEVRLKSDQLLDITEYMHPRLEEVCETLPAGMGRQILGNERLSGWLQPLFRKGRHVKTTRLRWFLALKLVAGMRRWRRSTLKYEREQARIEEWLDLVAGTAGVDQEAAAELVECQRLIKGYGDTFARGVSNYRRVVAAYLAHRSNPDAAALIRRLREAALADDESKTLGTVLDELRLAS